MRYRRRTETDLDDCDGYLYGACRLLPGELLSSWLWRVASSQYCRPTHIRSLIELRGDLHDLDFGPASRATRRLARLTQTDCRAIEKAQTQCGTLLRHQWLKGITFDFRSATPIYRYCPLCLRCDAVAHFRCHWRTAYTYACETHKVGLRDSCQACGRRINLSVSEIGAEWSHGNPLTNCSECFFELARAETLTLDGRLMTILLDRQAALGRLFSQGYLRHPRLGTISAVNVIDQYLVVSERPSGRGRGYCSLDFRRVYGPWADDLAMYLGATLDLGSEAAGPSGARS